MFCFCALCSQNRYVQVTGENLVIPLRCHCLTTVLLTVALSHTSILASYFFTATSNNTVPEVFLYSYLATYSNLTGLFWYFVCAALRCAAIRLKESLFKARHNLIIIYVVMNFWSVLIIILRRKHE
jgi:hypothetical protein